MVVSLADFKKKNKKPHSYHHHQYENVVTYYYTKSGWSGDGGIRINFSDEVLERMGLKVGQKVDVFWLGRLKRIELREKMNGFTIRKIRQAGCRYSIDIPFFPKLEMPKDSYAVHISEISIVDGKMFFYLHDRCKVRSLKSVGEVMKQINNQMNM